MKKNTKAILVVSKLEGLDDRLIEKALFISADNEDQIQHYLRTNYLDDVVVGYIDTADDCYQTKREPAGFLRWINRCFFVSKTKDGNGRRDKTVLHYLQLVMDNKIDSKRVVLGAA